LYIPLSGTNSLLLKVKAAYRTLGVEAIFGFGLPITLRQRHTQPSLQGDSTVHRALANARRGPYTTSSGTRWRHSLAAAQWHRPGSGQIDTIRVEGFFEMVELHLYAVVSPLGSTDCRI